MAPGVWHASDFSGWDLDIFPSFPLWLTCVCLDRDRMSLSGGLDRIGEVQIVLCGLFMLRRMRLLHAADGVGGPTTILYFISTVLVFAVLPPTLEHALNPSLAVTTSNDTLRTCCMPPSSRPRRIDIGQSQLLLCGSTSTCRWKRHALPIAYRTRQVLSIYIHSLKPNHLMFIGAPGSS